MSDTERRHQLREALQRSIGPRPADTLMEVLPPFPWDELATKSDLAALRTELGGDIADLRSDFDRLEVEFGGLRSEFGGLRSDFGRLEGDLRADLGRVHQELGTLSAKVDGLIPSMWRANLAFTVAVLGLLLAFTGLR